MNTSPPSANLRRFILLWCNYDADNYMGHRIYRFDAPDLTSAKLVAKEFLDSHWRKMNFEFELVECVAESHSRLWDTRDCARKNENDYTTKNYWEKNDD